MSAAPLPGRLLGAVVVGVLLWMAPFSASAALPREMERPPLPAMTDAHVNDHAGFFNPADKNALRVRLRALAADGGLHVVVVTVPWVEPEHERAAAWAKHLYEGWATEAMRRSRGLLVLVSRQPRVVELHGGAAAHQPVQDFGDDLVHAGEAAVEGSAPSGPLRAAVEAFAGRLTERPWYQQSGVEYVGAAFVLLATLCLAAVAFFEVRLGPALVLAGSVLLVAVALVGFVAGSGNLAESVQDVLDTSGPAGWILLLLLVVAAEAVFPSRRRSLLSRLLSGR